MGKMYKAKGFVQNLKTMQMLPAVFDVVVSKDSHTTITIAFEKLEMAYCVNFTQIIEELNKMGKVNESNNA